MKEENNFLIGVNNYCQTNHTINERQKMFDLKGNKLAKKCTFCENQSFVRSTSKQYKDLN